MKVWSASDPHLWRDGAKVEYKVGRTKDATVDLRFSVEENGTKTVAIGNLWRSKWHHTQQGGRWPFTKIVREIAKFIRKAQTPIQANKGDLFEVQKASEVVAITSMPPT